MFIPGFFIPGHAVLCAFFGIRSAYIAGRISESRQNNSISAAFSCCSQAETGNKYNFYTIYKHSCLFLSLYRTVIEWLHRNLVKNDRIAVTLHTLLLQNLSANEKGAACS